MTVKRSKRAVNKEQSCLRECVAYASCVFLFWLVGPCTISPTFWGVLQASLHWLRYQVSLETFEIHQMFCFVLHFLTIFRHTDMHICIFHLNLNFINIVYLDLVFQLLQDTPRLSTCPIPCSFSISFSPKKLMKSKINNKNSVR